MSKRLANRASAVRSPQLKEFTARRVEASRLEIGCRNCKRKFWVSRAWRKSDPLPTRPCPYCFKTSYVPARNDK